jgi:hypothetical protein
MSIKHRKHSGSEDKVKVVSWSKNNLHKKYQKELSEMSASLIMKEYNKINLLRIMMKNSKIEKFPKGQDNIRIIDYKYNLCCQEMTRRNMVEMQKLRAEKKYHSR